MKTVQNLIDEERERQNPKFTEIVVKNMNGIEYFYNVSNLKEGEFLEFDGLNLSSDKTLIHCKIRGVVVSYKEKLM